MENDHQFSKVFEVCGLAGELETSFKVKGSISKKESGRESDLDSQTAGKFVDGKCWKLMSSSPRTQFKLSRERELFGACGINDKRKEF